MPPVLPWIQQNKVVMLILFPCHKNGMTLETLQNIFNHSSPATTLRYIGITKETIIDAYNSIHL